MQNSTVIEDENDLVDVLTSCDKQDLQILGKHV